MRFILALIATALTVLVLSTCETVIPEFQPPDVVVSGDTIFLVDDAGEKWDITLAENKYGMNRQRWQYGLGRNAICPMIEPEMLSPGHRAYPSPDDNRICIATTINGESRAYAIDDLNSHEVVDEYYGETAVAVGW